ncbi:MAG: PBP1A family penicillin-binding protein [Desulfomonilia bacterium]|jgi:penicillin-binding protein 1A
MKWLKIFAGLLVCIVFLVGLWTYWFVYRGLPSIDELKKPEPTRLSTVIASDGSLIGCFPPDGMIIQGENDIPLRLKQCFIAAEDSTFYEHTGLDLPRIMAALIADIRANSFVQGASTITQQVVRSYLLTREKTITRKLKEIVLALRIERALSKEEILHLYLDRLYLGSGAYGVGAASLRYFNKDCRDLTLAEMAMIAGLAPAPARYSPLNDFPAAKRRQNYVLTRMITEGYITESEAKDAYSEPLMITGEAVALYTRYPYVTDQVKSQVVERYGKDILTSGLTIQTTISPPLQEAAMQAVRKGVIELEMRQGAYRGPEKGISETRKERILAFQENQLAWKGEELYQLYWAEVKTVSPLVVDLGGRTVELTEQSYAWINPKGSWTPAGVLEPGDVVRLCYTPDGFVLSQDPKVQASLVAFDLQTGGTVALVGGFDYSQSQFNRAVSARRQSGSAIKPFIYAAALDKGFHPASIIFDTPITFQEQEDEEPWKPKNYENRFYGATTLRTGLVLSRNVVTIKILNEIGIGYALNYLNRFGMEAEFPRDLSLALGSGSVTPYNLARGYAVFATYGQTFSPRLIDYITQADVGPIFSARMSPAAEAEAQGKRLVISEQTAYIITNILTDVVQSGTGWRAKALKRPVAGKTGTSDDNRDAWFIGYTPEMLCGVWVGYDDMMPLGENETGSRAACPIFLDFMQVALKDRPARDFQIPQGIVFAKVDTKTGRLASERSVDVRFECFKADSLPPREQSTYDDLLLKEVY